MTDFLEQLGDDNLLILTGVIVGLLFGVAAQQSRFCLRAATIEFWHAHLGPKVAVWLLVFSTALVLTQLQFSLGTLSPDSIRQLTGTGSLSGAIVGGLMFGAGMILARGCASRLLVLSATGNMRALTTGLIVTIIAQAAYTGILSPLREWITAWWLISGNVRNLAFYLPNGAPFMVSLLLMAFSILITLRNRLSTKVIGYSLLTGCSIALGWLMTSWHASWSYEIVKIQSVTFTGPSADTLMAVITSPTLPLNFGTGLVPGVFLGSMLASLVTKEFQLEAFTADTGMIRYLIGAPLMGFGGMLAGGCAVGAGVTGGAVLSLTSWTALLFMWLGAGMTDRLIMRTQT